MKLKRQLSPVSAELECTPEEIAQCKVGGYVDTESGARWLIQRINGSDGTIEVVLTVTEPFSLPPRGR